MGELKGDVFLGFCLCWKSVWGRAGRWLPQAVR